jgi:two-component system cell cycle sensor histidine kinase/response regulator CckA
MSYSRTFPSFPAHANARRIHIPNHPTGNTPSDVPLRLLDDAGEDYGIFMLDPTGHVTSWNTGAEDIKGYRASEIIGRNFSIFYEPQAVDKGGPQRELAVAQSAGRLEEKGWRIRKDGTRFWASVVITTMRDAVGNLLGFTKITRDLTERKRSADSLRSSEERFRAFMDHSPAASFIKDDDGRFLYVNATWRKQFDPEPVDWLGKTDYDFWPRETAEYFRASDSECLKNNAPWQSEERGHSSAGEMQSWMVMKFPLNESGQRRLGGIAWNITDRRRVQDALAESETRYRRLFEAAQDGILIVDTETRQVFDANPYMSKLMGYSREELIGKELWELGLVLNIDSNREAFQELLDAKYIRYDDLPLLTKEGHKIAVEFVSNVYDVGGKKVIQCNIRDISAWRDAEEALKLRDRAIMASTQGLMISDASLPENPIIYISPACERITGYTSEEMLGRNCRFLQGKDTDPDTVARIREAIGNERSCTVELLNYRKDGTPFWNELSISPIRDAAGRLTNFVGVQSDVTARRTLETQFQQSQKMEAVGQLAGGVAHDFNNLLTVISGYSEMLLETLDKDDENRESIRAIYQAGERAAGLTRQLLAFSRQSVLETKTLDLNLIVKETENMLLRMIGEDIALTTLLDPTISRVKVDPGQIGQVLMNLAVNARDAMPQGGKLTIQTSEIELDETYCIRKADLQPGRYIQLAVSDNGVGMPEEVKAHIFEPFFTTKGPGKGTGLGLATVYGIVKQSGGSVDLYSEQGQGTTFKIFLPAVSAGDVRTTQTPVFSKRTTGAETILLVEDEDAVRNLAEMVLRSQGYTVFSAENGERALRVVEANPGRFDLLVTDVVMPGMNGRVLAEKLLAEFPSLKVLYVSGYTDDAVIRHGILQVEVAFLQKPYTPIMLTKKVRNVLDQPIALKRVGGSGQ